MKTVPGAARRVRAARGQASVELALVLPVLVMLLLALVQTAVVARDELLVQDAARAAVREASVGASENRVRDAARRALPGVTVEVDRSGGVGNPVTVLARYHDRTRVPLIGPLFPDVVLHGRATMRAER
jgi:hypothetical protein